MTREGGLRPGLVPIEIDTLLEPAGIAVVGASADPGRIGGQPVHCLSTYGFPGRVYPVNPGHAQIMGLRCYPTIAAIDGPCDVALIAIPAAGVEEAVRQCGAKGIRYAVVLSSGFGEAGDDGRRMQESLVRTAHASGVRIVGPNCQGLLNASNHLYATFGAACLEPEIRQGAVSMVTQSGGYGFSVLLTCEALGLGFRAVVSTGNQADVDTPELLEALVGDAATRVLCAYIEGVSDGRVLMGVARRALAAGKPLLVWKTGNTESGARAALSHTASMAGRYEIYRAAFRQCGIIEVTDTHELADYAFALQAPVASRGRRTAALGISAGACILFADQASECGLPLPELSPETLQVLRGIVPAFGAIANPVDVTAAIFNDVRRFTDAVDVVLADPGIDQLAVLMASLSGEPAAACCEALVETMRARAKPVLVGWSARRNRAQEAYRILEEAGVPIFPSPVRLAKAAAVSCRFAEDRVRVGRRGWPDNAWRNEAHPPAPGRPMNEHQSKALVASWGIPVTKDVVASDPGGARRLAQGLRFPVVAKVLSADLPHKSDAGGVRLGIPDADTLERELIAMLAQVRRLAPGAGIEGVLVSEMVEDGLETILGVVHDPTFGPTVAFGLGGTLAEVLRDVTYRVAPVDRHEALEMIGELRARHLFDGARGKPALDKDALADAIAAVSRGAWEARASVVEVEINPLIVMPAGRGVIAADALVLPVRSGDLQSPGTRGPG
jgi:acyl-CoA synthetase (NDP forming)